MVKIFGVLVCENYNKVKSHPIYIDEFLSVRWFYKKYVQFYKLLC